ncbi:MAG TPA: acyl-CoA dehydrogenase [Mycobacteriales bacterium]|nr:acyl-CoA dehydrogenase [Mycobacteriales bacterium]
MDVRLSEEQRALRDAAASVVNRLGPGSVADLDDAARAQRLDAAVAAAGWRDLRAADDGGAPLASAVEVALVAEELARGPADAAYVGPVLAAELRRLAGGPPTTAAETVATRPDLAELAHRGRPALAIDAARAHRVLLLDAGVPTTAGQVRVVALPLVAAGPDAVDLTRRTANIDPAAGEAEPVGEVAGEDLVRFIALGLAVSCADLVGAMRGAIDLACSYATTRHQYGVPVGSFQAVQHLLADAYVAMEGSRSAALHAAWAVDALDPDEALAAASSAKAYCARAARSVCETAIQVHGGIGNTWECRAHLYLRRSLVSRELFGGLGTSLQRVLEHELHHELHHELGSSVGLR